ncbi:SCO3242 family prenyltransferase [Streptomyces sp. NPDC017993]|uniref:SCO3242 family prenyltransferase n=1 Tax=Streptomyces sp. NPDC017993 TaxID=3365027 RepID=UPI0037A13F6F
MAGSVGDSVTGRTGAAGPLEEGPARTARRPGAAPAPVPGRPVPLRARGRAWAELLRVSALFTVPGDLLAGAAAGGHRPDHRTLLATCSSLCLYEAGMALNDWADRGIDAVERPGRPLPSGRIGPAAAFAAACGLTAAGLAIAAAAGRPALLTGTALASTVWAYDLYLKNTPAGPAAMACARALDLLQGAVATGPRRAAGASTTAGPVRQGTGARQRAVAALPSAALLGAHTFAVTTVSRREAQGSSAGLPLTGLAAVAAVARAGARRSRPAGPPPTPVPAPTGAVLATSHPAGAVRRLSLAVSAAVPRAVRDTPATTAVTAALVAGYAATAARPLLQAALNPSPYFLQRAVGGGIRAMIPLQAALTARAGAPGTGAALLALIPAARRLSRKVSPT